MLNIWQYIKGIRIAPESTTTLDRLGEIQVSASLNKILFHNGTDSSPIVTESHSASLTNKTIDGNFNTITNVGDSSLGSNINANKIANGSVSNTEYQYLDGVTSPIQTQLDSKQPTITNNSITNAQLAQMPAHTIKGNNTSSTANAADLTATQVTAELNVVVGDSGSGGTKGLVPAPSAGDAAAGKFLKADGTYAVPPGSGGSVSTIGTINSQTKSANALVISGSSLVAQTADTSFPGMVSTGTQTFAGQKAFNNNIVGASIIGFPDLTIQPVSPNDLSLFTAGSSRLKLNGTSGVNIKEIVSAPVLPDSGFDSLYFKADHNLYSVDSSGNEKPIGAGTGGSLNFIGLNTSFQSVNLNDITAESSTGNWATYKSGTTQPTTLTGGSATHLTLSRTTTVGEVLDGSGSFKIVKTANNSQGEGVSVVGNVPLGYRGQIASIQIPFKIISGSLLSSDLNLFIEDVTNSTIIVPYNNGVLNSPSILQASFSVPPTCTQIRIGFHFSSTSASAVTFSWDDVFVGPQQLVFGPTMTDWKSDLTFSVNGVGAFVNSNFWYKRIGDTMFIRGTYQNGNTASSIWSISLPIGYTIDSTKLTSGTRASYLGFGALGTSASGNIYSSIQKAHSIFYDGSATDRVFVTYLDDNSTTFVKINGNDPTNPDNAYFAFDFSIPIVGWTTSVASVNSSVFNISSILQNGTRITGSAPTQLGQYRSYLRNSGGGTFTETNGSPAITPTSSNGIALYAGNGFGSNDNNNEPTRYDIFIGKNKTYKFQSYQSSGRTGFLDIEPIQINSTTSVGYNTSYDPTTGIFSIQPYYATGSETTHQIGFIGTTTTTTTTSFFEVIVSENALAVQQASQFQLYTSNAVTTQSSALSSATYVNFDNSPAFTFTPTITGKYKVYSNPGLQNSSNANLPASIRVFNTSGSASLITESKAFIYSSFGNVEGTVFIQNIYTLVAGNSYVFDIQGKTTANGLYLDGSEGNDFVMFAEFVGV